VNEEDDKKGALAQMFGGWNRLRSNPLADIALGFTPAGVAADVQDVSRAINERDALGLGLAGLGFIPGVGDVVKKAGSAARKALPQIDSRLLNIVKRNPGSDVPRAGDITPYSRAELESEGFAGRADTDNPDIPMDPESRLQRMAEQGYDVTGPRALRPYYDTESPVMYHSSRLGPIDVTEVEDRPMWMTPNQSQSETYLADSPDDFVLPLVTRPGRGIEIDGGGAHWSGLSWEMVGDAIDRAERLGDQKALDDIFEAVEKKYDKEGAESIRSAIWKGYDPDSGGLLSEPSERYLTTDEVAGLLQEAGFDSADFRRVADYDPDGVERVFGFDEDDLRSPDVENMMSRVVFDPSRIRHVDATFDPNKMHLRNLLAGTAGAFGAGTAARMMNQNREER